MEPNLA